MEDSSMVASGSGETKQKIESKPTVENKPASEKKGKSSKFWIILGVGVLFVLSASFMVIPYFRGVRAAVLTKFISAPKEKREVKATVALDPFLVNLADTDEVRFVKTTFQLGLEEEPKEEFAKGPAIAAMRDAIISLLSSKKAEQILTPHGKETLRQEIRSRINKLSPDTNVLEVYIVDFVVQL